jgi:hypothetical protein
MPRLILLPPAAPPKPRKQPTKAARKASVPRDVETQMRELANHMDPDEKIRMTTRGLEFARAAAIAYAKPSYTSDTGDGLTRRHRDGVYVAVDFLGKVVECGNSDEDFDRHTRLADAVAVGSQPKARGTGGGHRLPTSIDEVLARLDAAGCRVVSTEGAHIKVGGPLGGIVTVPKTPSDHRTYANIVRDVWRVFGIDIGGRGRVAS